MAESALHEQPRVRQTPVAAVSVLLAGRFHETVFRSIFSLMSRTLAAAISISLQMNHDPSMQMAKRSKAASLLAADHVPGNGGSSDPQVHALRVGMNSSVMALFCVTDAIPLRMLRSADLMDLRMRTETGKPVSARCFAVASLK